MGYRGVFFLVFFRDFFHSATETRDQIIMYLPYIDNYISYVGERYMRRQTQGRGSRFPRPIILPESIDGGRRWGGTQKPRDGFWERFPTPDHPTGEY
jgi:hypothetical protein